MDRRSFLQGSTALTGFFPASRLLGSPLKTGRERQAPRGGTGTAPVSGNPSLDLSQAVVVAPHALSQRERKAVQVLTEEVEKRTEIRWPVVERLTPDSSRAVVVGSYQALKRLDLPLFPAGVQPTNPEGYRLHATARSGSTVVLVSGSGERGALYGVGGLLRRLRMSKGQVGLDGPLDVATAPKYKLRGHQLGYRPKTNAYDAWNVPMWDQYLRDLSVFGTNAIELIPPRSDDEPNSPHFTLPPMQMMVEMSRLADEYGLDVWIWYPAMDRDYSNPTTVEFALREWGEIFKALPRIDAVFVPGGDPGDTEPKALMALLEKQTENLHRYHPRAQMWMSPQSFDEGWMNEFFAITAGRPDWLSGVVYGPQTRMGISALRKRLRYPIRLYPDVTHSVECQFPAPDWDLAYALTEGREVINPRPRGYADIFRLQAPYSIGFITYSEGCNDDVNKCLWSALGWDSERPVIDILRDYSGYFISDRLRDDFAQGLLSLEENWQGALLSNGNVETTLEQFQSMESEATPGELENWRFQMGLYRAYYDVYVRRRLIAEQNAEYQALDALGAVRQVGARPYPLDVGGAQVEPTSDIDLLVLLDEAEKCLNGPLTAPPAREYRTRILELGEALFQSIHMQLAVERYQAEAVSRAANLDTLDAPLNNAPWLKKQFAGIRKLSSYQARYKAIAEVLDRTNPGPGGFYDDLGDLLRQPHLVRGLGAKRDPEFRQSSLVGHGYPEWSRTPVPVAWKCWAESLYDAPLEMLYHDLDPMAPYRLRVVYAGDSMRQKIRLLANGSIEIHGYINKPWPIQPLEFDIPAHATAGGELRLSWNRPPGLGHNGRGCQVAEVWLMKKPQTAPGA